jgi:hypothetical protein
MDADLIKRALADITAEQDPTLKSAKMASICSALFLEHGIELVVVGGSGIELLTDGAYTSGDLDLCHTVGSSIPPRLRHEIMGLLGGTGGPRNWLVAGMYVDILGVAENFARTPRRVLAGPYGPIKVIQAEDLFVERVLGSFYPQENLAARNCARILAGVALKGQLGINWQEVARVARLPEYRNLEECKTLLKEVADELGIKSPYVED